MLNLWYFIWFTFRVVALAGCATSFNVIMQPFAMTLKSSQWALSGSGLMSMVEQQWDFDDLFFVILLSMILVTNLL
jgi:hypothetical protein